MFVHRGEAFLELKKYIYIRSLYSGYALVTLWQIRKQLLPLQASVVLFIHRWERALIKQTYLFFREEKAWFLELKGRPGKQSLTPTRTIVLTPPFVLSSSITGAFSHVLPGETPSMAPKNEVVFSNTRPLPHLPQLPHGNLKQILQSEENWKESAKLLWVLRANNIALIDLLGIINVYWIKE